MRLPTMTSIFVTTLLVACAITTTHARYIPDEDVTCSMRLTHLRIIPNKKMMCGTVTFENSIDGDRYSMEQPEISLTYTIPGDERVYTANLTNWDCREDAVIHNRVGGQPKNTISLCTNIYKDAHLSHDLIFHNLHTNDGVPLTIIGQSHKVRCSLSWGQNMEIGSLIHFHNVTHVDPCTGSCPSTFCKQMCYSLAQGDGGVYQCRNQEQQLVANSLTLMASSKTFYVDSHKALCIPVRPSFSKDIGRQNNQKVAKLSSGVIPVLMDVIFESLYKNKSEYQIVDTIEDGPNIPCQSLGAIIENSRMYMCAWFESYLPRSTSNKMLVIYEHSLTFDTVTIDGTPLSSSTKLTQKMVNPRKAIKQDVVYNTCPDSCNNCVPSCSSWLKGDGPFYCKDDVENVDESTHTVVNNTGSELGHGQGENIISQHITSHVNGRENVGIEMTRQETTSPTSQGIRPETTTPTSEMIRLETTSPTSEMIRLETTSPTSQGIRPETTTPTSEMSRPETTTPTSEMSRPETTTPTLEMSRLETKTPLLENVRTTLVHTTRSGHHVHATSRNGLHETNHHDQVSELGKPGSKTPDLKMPLSGKQVNGSDTQTQRNLVSGGFISTYNTIVTSLCILLVMVLLQ